MKEKIKLLIQELQKRDKIMFSGSGVSLKKEIKDENKIVSRANEEKEEMDKEKQEENPDIVVMKLLISTESISPIQKSFGGATWDEIISESAFDESIKQRNIFSFLDHDINIEKMIGSTANETMTIKKEKEGYVAEVKLSRNNPKHQQVIYDLENGFIRENSFIFKPVEVDYQEDNEREHLRVIHKKGELISVDPVAMAFYPQNQVSFNSTLDKKEIVEKEENQKKENSEMENQLDLLKKENEELKNSIEAMKKETEEVVAETRKINNEFILNLRNEQERKNTEKRNADMSKINVLDAFLKKGQTDLEKETIKNYHRNLFANNEKLFNDTVGGLGLKLEFRDGMVGTDYSNGQAYISSIVDKDIRSEMSKVFPEIDGAQIIQHDNLDIIHKPLFVSPSTQATEIGEDQAAQKVKGTVLTVPFENPKLHQEYSVNPAVPNYQEILAQMIRAGWNSFLVHYRKKFYENMFKHKEKTLAEVLLEANKYTGGIVKDNLVQNQDVNNFKLSHVDLDALINWYEGEYGIGVVQNEFVILMHSDTFSWLEKEAITLQNAGWLMNGNDKFYRGIKVIISNQFPKKVNPATGIGADKDVVVVFIRKNSVVVRGLNAVVQQSIYENMNKNHLTTFQLSRGQVKLVDPINTRAIQLGTVTRSTISKENVKAIEDRELLEKLSNNVNYDEDSQRLIKSRIKELQK